MFAPQLRLSTPWEAHTGFQIYLGIAISVAIIAGFVVFYWSRNKWNNHPIASQLGYLGESDSNWRSVASSINIEFRRIDKFSSGPPTGSRVIVTDSWVMKTTTYFVYVTHQNDIHLNLSASEEHNISYENMASVQFVHIDVISANSKISNFTIRYVYSFYIVYICINKMFIPFSKK